MRRSKILKKEKKLVYRQKKKIIYFLINYFNWIILSFVLIILALGYFLFIQPKYAQITQELSVISAGKEEKYVKRQEYLDQLIEDGIVEENPLAPGYYGLKKK